MIRSASSDKSRIRQYRPANGKAIASRDHSRESSAESTKKSFNCSKAKFCFQDTLKESFIKPKYSSKQYHKAEIEPMVEYRIEESILRLGEITKKFNLKTIEKMKKNYAFSIMHETVYKNFVSLMAELDSIFSDNQVLQFSISRAREIFQLYMSRTGHVLTTIKALPSLVQTTRISKSVVSRCKHDMKSISGGKSGSLISNIFEILKIIVEVQDAVFKTEKLFFYTESSKINTNGKTLKTVVTEERNLDVSIMELHTEPTDYGNLFTSPMVTYESEELIEPFFLNPPIEPKSSKSKLLQKLYHKMNFMLDKPTEQLEPILQENVEPVGIRIKPCRRSSSGSSIPNYMKSLKKDQISLQKENALHKNTLKVKISQLTDKKSEWEEIRMVKNI